jgi:imidazolonepropionase
MAGGDYRDIAAAGGGIVSTHRAIAAASLEELAASLVHRLERMAALGVTTVEVKSGYGLLPEEERKQLGAIAVARARAELPRVVPTFLALHALPPNAVRDDYVARAIAEVEPIARADLAAFVDAYVDPHAFTVSEARALGDAAKRAGLGVRMHIGQFGDIGGAELAADLGAKSADHLEHVSDVGIDVLARGGVAAVLLPVASYTLGQAPPPIAKLRKAGVTLVVASDANPGTAPTESLPLAMALAVRTYGLTPDETILAATRNAAQTLSCEATGMLREGDPADLVVWDLPHEHAIIQPWGTSKAALVIRNGIGIH